MNEISILILVAVIAFVAGMILKEKVLAIFRANKPS